MRSDRSVLTTAQLAIGHYNAMSTYHDDDFWKVCFRCSAPAVWNPLPKTVVNSDSVTVSKSRLKTFLFSRVSLFPLLSSTLPGPSASEVTTLRRYTNTLLYCVMNRQTDKQVHCTHTPWSHVERPICTDQTTVLWLTLRTHQPRNLAVRQGSH